MKRIALYVVAIAALIGGVALFVLAAHWAPTEPHHGEAIDGLDGLGTAAALLAGLGGLIAFLIAWLAWRAAVRSGSR